MGSEECLCWLRYAPCDIVYSCSPAPATVRSGQTRSEKLLCFWLFSALPVSPWLANSTTFGRVPVSTVSGTGAASLPEQ
ncbi:hypothetical protein J6590_064482 [Homalodisca vitripennis]|nr:hypothetical protein J6590_064482 [Homalodisca vitripennis]